MAFPRSRVVDPDVSAVYHCTSRCVRGVSLLGRGDDSRRKEMIYEQLLRVADAFGIVVGGYAILSNHLHVVVKTMPEWAKDWTREEVARRWLRLHPPVGDDGRRRSATEQEVRQLATRPERIRVLRRRLHDVSWFMKLIKEPIAKRCNEEDGVRGAFWEGRFKCEVLLDEIAALTCCAYVDLNWVRAAMARTPEESTYTSIKERVDAWRGGGADAEKNLWLSPIGPQRTGDSVQPGFLSIPLDEYLRIVDLTGRAMRADKPGAIPDELAPILERLNVDPARWSAQMCRGGRGVGTVIGSAIHRAREAARRGGHWVVSAMRVYGKAAEAVPG